MKKFLIVLGCSLAVICGIIIFVEKTRCAELDKYRKDHPWESAFFPNPIMRTKAREAYTYTPPFTNHEILVMGGVACGIVMVFVGASMKKKSED